MNWIEELDKRRRLIIGGVLLISLSSLLLALLRNPVSLDAFWHLQMGKDWIENGLSPWIDHYSFTFNGHPLSNPPVLFQALLHFSVSQFGARAGFLAVKALAYFLIIGCALLALRQWKAPAIFYAMVVPVIVFLLQLRSLVRPELFSYAFSILALMLYFRAKNEINVRHLLPMVALMLLWTNYHNSVIGYVIFFGFFLDSAVSQINTRAKPGLWFKWLSWGSLLFAVGFLNHDFSHPFIETLLFPEDWKILIREYFSPVDSMKPLIGIYLVIVVALIMPALALKQRRFGLVIIWAVLAYQAAKMHRMVTPSGIVITMMAAHLLIRAGFPGDKQFTDSKLGKLRGGFCLLFVGFALYSNFERALNFMNENKKTHRYYPEALTSYMLKKQIHGKIFNEYGIGGYLIYRLSPDSQVYIDGRTQILYPVEFMQKFEETKKSPEALRVEVDRYDVDLIILASSKYFLDLVTNLGVFGLDFVDANVALFRRDSSNFWTLGRLMSLPACWREEMHETVVKERDIAHRLLPANRSVASFADFVFGFSSSSDKRAFMDQSFDEFEWSDDVRRFAAYRFLEIGDYDVARVIVGGIAERMPEDYLVASLAMVQAENYELAATILNEYSSGHWVWLKPEYQAIALQLYQAIAEHRALSPMEQGHSDELSARVAETGLPDSNRTLGVERFCP